MVTNINIPKEQIARFCQKWNITELAVFGSVLRDDFTPDSDIDVLATFRPDARYTFADLMAMEAELKAIFECDVDLGERQSVEEDANYIRRKTILGSAQVIYDADR